MARRGKLWLLVSLLVPGCQPSVSPGGGAPTCSVTVSPASGDRDTLFSTTVTSKNASTCTWSLDGKGAIPIGCASAFSETGAQAGGVGKHTITISAMGTGGPATCAASWTVTDGGSVDGGVPPTDMAVGGSDDMAGMAPVDMATPPSPDLAVPPTMLDLHDAIVFDNPPNLADWPVTTQITEVDFQYMGQDGVHVEFSKRCDGTWPDVTPPGWTGPLEYTLGMAEYINGQWYASAAIQFWRGLEASGGNVALDNQIAKNWYYDGRWGNLAGRQPATGEYVGIFVVAGNVRGVTDGSQSPVMERSNVVLVPFPDVSGAKYTF